MDMVSFGNTQRGDPMTHLFSHEGFDLKVATTEPEKAEVQAFLQVHAQRSFQCEPPPSEGILIGAWENAEVVGSVVLDFRTKDEPFPLEGIYAAAAFLKLFPEGFDRTIIAQAGRWFSARSGSSLSRSLLRAMSEYSIAHGKKYILGEGKLYTLELFSKFGYRRDYLTDYKPDLEKIPELGRRYYQIDPPPHLFRIIL